MPEQAEKSRLAPPLPFWATTSRRIAFFSAEETLSGKREPKISPKRVWEPKPLDGRRGKMRAYTVGLFSAAVLLAVAGIGFGIAQAEGTHWNVEALDSFYVDQPGSSMAMESPIETGSLPSERYVEALDSFYVDRTGN
jgi:hypothetical protein